MSVTPPGSRRFVLGSAAALLSVAVLTVPQSARGAGPACGVKLGFLGALSGDAGALGRSMVNGEKLAITQYNSQHPGCTVGLDKYDSQGDPAKAPAVAAAATQNSAIVGIVGPGFSGEALATGSIFASAGLTTITPSATNPMLATQHWATFHRVIDNDTSGGRLLATYIRTTLQGTKVAVVNDGGDYGKAFARSVQNPLGKRVVLTATVSESRTTFKTLIKHIRAKHAKVVVFGGYDPQAGLLAKQLVKAGYPGKIVTGDGAMDSGFARTAGAKAAARTFLAAGIAPPTLNASFTTAYHAAYGKAPAFYALESYDAARVFLAGIGQGAGTRAAVLDAVDHYDASGLTKKIAFTSHGELVHPTLWVYQPKGTGFVAKAHLR